MMFYTVVSFNGSGFRDSTLSVLLMIPKKNMRRGKSSPKTYRQMARNASLGMGNVLRTPSVDRTVHRFTQHAQLGYYGQGVTELTTGVDFKLSYLSQASTFASLFDQYMINRVEVTLYPMYRATSISGVANPYYLQTPLIYSTYDPDDNNALSSSAITEYQNCEIHDDSAAFTVGFQPKAAVALYRSTTAAYAATDKPLWIDCSSTDVPHYGFKFTISAGGVGQTSFQAWNVTAKYFLSFRAVR